MSRVNRQYSMRLFTPRHRRIANQGAQRPTEAVSTQRRKNERKALNLNAYAKLDKTQEYAETGDVIPLVFCKRSDGNGGAWVAPVLIDTASENFDQTFIYLVSSGSVTLPPSKKDYFLGKNNLLSVEEYATTSLTLTGHYTSNDTVCPIAGFATGCVHNKFKFLVDALVPDVNSAAIVKETSIRFQTVDQYATKVTIQAIPERPRSYFLPPNFTEFTITVDRLDNNTGTSTTVGTFTTPSDDVTPTSFVDNPPTGSYTYSLRITAIASLNDNVPASILFEVEQENNFPTSVDRKASYVDMTLLSIQGNLYDVDRFYSPPAEIKQLFIFVSNGIAVEQWRFVNPSISNPGGFTFSSASSNRIGDLMLYYIQNSGRYLQAINYQAMLYSDIATAALFHDIYKLNYDGVISDSVNFTSWTQEIAPMFLCKFFVFNGIFRLRPLLPLTDSGQISSAALTPVTTFTDLSVSANSTEGTIIAGSYSKTYTSTADRLPVRVVVIYKRTSRFYVEVPTTAKVRYTDYAKISPEETYDLTEFCTNDDHAILYAKYLLATRRYSTHRISFQTTQNPNDLIEGYKPLDLIAVSIKREDSSGTNRIETNHYLVESLEMDTTTGITTIHATYFPLDGAGVSIISASVLSGSFDVEV